MTTQCQNIEKDYTSSPFLVSSIFHSVFTVLHIYKHENSLHYHGNSYINTKTHSQFPCSYKGFA